MRQALVALIELYQRTWSPDHSPRRRLYPHGFCRYHPTCSMYAKEAIGRHGTALGLWLTIKRLIRCHPWSAGGLDPVPHP